MSKRAAIDIGSNSVLLTICAFQEDHWITLEDHSEVTRLGKNIDKTGHLDTQSKLNTKIALERYCKVIDSYSIAREDVLISATEAARVAKDFEQFKEEIQRDLNLKIQIITAQGEAYYSALGVCQSTNSDNLLICDLGGASTELIEVQSRPFDIKRFVSLPIGSVRSFDWFAEDSFDSNWQHILDQYEKHLDSFQSDQLIAVAGTLTSLACYLLELKEFDGKKIDQFEITSDELFRKLIQLKSTSIDELNSKFPYLSKRNPTLFPGSFAFSKVIERLQVKRIKFSTRGLRFGLIREGEIKQEFIHGTVSSI